MEKEVKRRIKSIIEVLVFLIVMTFYWYGPREDITQMAANVGSIVNKNVVVKEYKNYDHQVYEEELKDMNKFLLNIIK